MNILGCFLIKHLNPVSRNSGRINKTDKNIMLN